MGKRDLYLLELTLGSLIFIYLSMSEKTKESFAGKDT